METMELESCLTYYLDKLIFFGFENNEEIMVMVFWKS